MDGETQPRLDDGDAFVAHPTSGPRSLYGDFAAFVSQDHFDALGGPFVVVSRRVGDNPATAVWPVDAHTRLQVLCRLLVDDDPPAPNAVRLDQTLRFAIGIPHQTTAEKVWLHPVHASWMFRARESIASYFGTQVVIGRATVSWLSAAEKGVVEVRDRVLPLLGCEQGGRVRFHGLDWSTRRAAFDVFTASVPVLGVDHDTAAQRVRGKEPGDSDLYVDPRSLFGFTEEYGQQEDIPEVWMDQAVRDLVGTPVLTPVRIRRSVRSSIASEFRTTGLFVALAVVALTQVFGVQSGVVPGLAALGVSFTVAMVIIAWGLRQRVAAPHPRRR